LIVKSLDSGLYYGTSRSLHEADLKSAYVRVSQSGAPRSTNWELFSCPDTPVVAIVERDADLESAAASLVRARFGLNGTSPYGPDIVLVSEWVKDNFLGELSRASSAFPADARLSHGRTAPNITRSPVLNKLNEKGNINVISFGSIGTIVDIRSRLVLLLYIFLFALKGKFRCD
jgi:hypothetical protein